MKQDRQRQPVRPGFVRPLAGGYLVYLGARLLYDFFRNGQDGTPVPVIFGAAALFLAVGGWLLRQEWVRYQYEKAHKDDPESWNDELAEEAERRRSAGEDAPAEAPEDGEDAL